MTDISSLVPIIKEEIEKERQETFEAAKERDKGRNIVPDASLPDGPATWSILKPSPPPERPSLAALLKYCYRNELGDAELFQYLHRNQFIYDHSTEQWFEFDGIRWVRDKIQKTQRSVMEMAEIYESAEYIKADEAEVQVGKLLKQADEAANSGEEDARQEAEDLKKQAYKLQKALLKKVALLSKRAESLRSTRRVSSVLKAAAQGEDSLGISGSEWHGHPELLPCANGIINLRTGELMRPDPSLYLQHMSPCEYRGLHYEDQFWEDHLDKIFCKNEALKRFFGLAIGLSATGYSHKSVFVAYGPASNNGKSVTFDAIRDVLGGYATQLKVSALIDDKASKRGPNPDLMELANGIRMSISSENARGEKFRIDILKAISGGDKITERDLYEGNISFQPQCKLWLHTNHIPEMNGYDPGFQNRIKVIPFMAEFVKDPSEVNEEKHIYLEMEKEIFKKRIKEAYPGILSYIVRNARKFLLGEEFTPPPIIQEYTSEYVEDQDLVGEFIQMCCERDENSQEQSKTLYAAFCKFCKDEKSIPEKMLKSQRSFMAEIRLRKLDVKTSNRTYVIGILIKNEWLPSL